MDILEAVRSRKSIRGYKPDPVPKEILKEILDIATR
ncbi:MAG: nitroreductase family protein, partial [Chloroflexi bacterium]|nr:nitroreductase family protein [Chloroflexota bacterium]